MTLFVLLIQSLMNSWLPFPWGQFKDFALTTTNLITPTGSTKFPVNDPNAPGIANGIAALSKNFPNLPKKSVSYVITSVN